LDLKAFQEETKLQIRVLGVNRWGKFNEKNPSASDIVTVTKLKKLQDRLRESFRKSKNHLLETPLKTLVFVPEGAFYGKAEISVKEPISNLHDLSGSVKELGQQGISRFFNIEALNPQGGIFGVPSKPLEVKLAYHDEDNDGYVDGTSVHESSLTLHYFHQHHHRWKTTLRPVIDNSNNVLTVKVVQLSDFGIFGKGLQKVLPPRVLQARGDMYYPRYNWYFWRFPAWVKFQFKALGGEGRIVRVHVDTNGDGTMDFSRRVYRNYNNIIRFYARVGKPGIHHMQVVVENDRGIRSVSHPFYVAVISPRHFMMVIDKPFSRVLLHEGKLEVTAFATQFWNVKKVMFQVKKEGEEEWTTFSREKRYTRIIHRSRYHIGYRAFLPLKEYASGERLQLRVLAVNRYGKFDETYPTSSQVVTIVNSFRE
jgi:hypothetical protein